MKKRECSGAVIGLLVAGVAAAIAQGAPQANRTTVDAHRALGAPVAFRNLTIFPVYDTAERTGAAYTTLDEGLKAKTVRVKEAQGGGEVNQLFISNSGNRPVYLMAGEVVLGGQQDRCIGHDTIIPPGKKMVPVTVFCVEHGRWTGHADFDSSAQTVASYDIRADAQAGAFAASRPAAMPGRGSGRSAGLAGSVAATPNVEIVGEAQSKVWSSVAAKNARFKAAPSTGTYRQVLNMEAAGAQNSVAPYLSALKAGLGSDPHLVGAVAAVNGEMVAADVFGDPALFLKLWPKLLRSYAADAAENYTVHTKRNIAATADRACSFLLNRDGRTTKAESRAAGGELIRRESKSSVTYRLSPLGVKTGTAGAALHENVLRK